LKGASDVRLDGRDSNKFAPRTVAAKTAQHLRWCGNDEVLTAKSFLLRAPLVYYSLEAPADDEPSCIDLSLDVQPPGRFVEPAPGTYPTYAGLSPAHRAGYLQWLAKDRTSSMEHIGFAFLYLCGLERRLFLDRADLHEIVKEAVRLRAAHSSARVFGLRVNQFLAFALAGREFDNAGSPLMKLAFENPPPHSTKDDMAVALAWFCEHQIPLPASWALAVARTDRRFASGTSPASETDRSASLFKMRYLEHSGGGMKLKPSSLDRQLWYQPINVSLQYQDQSEELLSWSIRIPDVLGHESQFTPLADLFSRAIGDLQGPAPAIVTRPDVRPPVRKTAAAGAPPVEHTDRTEPPPAKEPDAEPAVLRWQGSGEPISVKGYVLRDPMVYTSVGRPDEPEASCIDLSLDIGKPAWQAAGALGYDPTYATITPTQRANYLSWLANGRTRPLADIGYAFLFFYGLERRLLIDCDESSEILRECLRLLKTYTFSSSFDGYLSRFLAFILARTGIQWLKEKWFKAVFEKSRLQRHDDCLAVALAWFFKKGTPLPVSWAMRVARQDPRSPVSIATDRLPDEFKTLFESRYREEFGAGIVLRAPKRNRPLGYVPASPSLLGDLGKLERSNLRIGIPNVLGIPSQFAPLVAIWSSCVQELKPLSRIVARGISVDSREAFHALPDELKATVEHPDQETWNQLVLEHSGDDGFALLPISSLAALHGIPERARLTRVQSEALAQTAQFVGLVIEPDARLTGRPYAWQDVVSLLRHGDGEELGRLDDDSRYLAASLMLELGIYIAAADGAIDDREVDQVARFIESQFLLGSSEVRRIEALKRVFVARPPTLGGLGKRLQSALTRDQREAVGRFLTGVAAANGIINRQEISALKNAYRALDIGVDQLDLLLEESRRTSQEPVEVEREDDSAAKGEIIPPRPQPGRPAGIVLDDRRLSAILAETQIVIETLGKAMLDPAIADEPQEPPALPVNDPRFESLDARYHAMLAQLLGRPVWDRLEFHSLARAHNLMPSGAFDAVNDWACELFDDPIVVEQGDQFQIQIHLIETS
jgi:uncharacterized tellurite resistance protein B-like protein